MKDYIVFWTYEANYAAAPMRVKAVGPMNAIGKAWPQYAKDVLRVDEGDFTANLIRFLVFEVGGDLVLNGVYRRCEAEREVKEGVA